MTDVDFDSFDDASSIATLRITASEHAQHEDIFLDSLMTAVKIEMGLPPSADISLHVEGTKVHATLGKNISSRAQVEDFKLLDIFTLKSIVFQDAILTYSNVILLFWTTQSKAALKETQEYAIQLFEKHSTTLILAVHVGDSPQDAANEIVNGKLFYPQQNLHHYQIERASYNDIRAKLSVNDDSALYILCNKKREILATSNTISNLEAVQSQPALNSTISVPIPSIHTTHDDCDGLLYPNVEVIHMQSRQAGHLFDYFKPGTLAVIDFWSTTCIRCPAAVSKLLHHKSVQVPNTKIQYILINTDNVEKGWSIVQDNEWESHGNLVHLHVTLPVKESLKQFMAMKQLPHHVLLNADHKVVKNGKYFSYDIVDSELQALKAPTISLSFGFENEMEGGSSHSSQTFVQPAVHTAHDDCDGLIYPNVEVLDMESQETKNLFDYLNPTKLTVIDFWSTTCVRCPAAVSKLLHHKSLQPPNAKVQYVLINTDNAEKGWSIVQDNEWEPNGTVVHLHVTLPVKESLKQFMAMKQMPHHVLLDLNNRVVKNGKFFSYDRVDMEISAIQPTSLSKNSFDLNEPMLTFAPAATPCMPQPLAVPTTPVATTHTTTHAFVLDDDF